MIELRKRVHPRPNGGVGIWCVAGLMLPSSMGCHKAPPEAPALDPGFLRERDGLVARLVQIDDDGAHRDRMVQIDNLASMYVTDQLLLRLRDGCVRGHRALIAAEEEQARARALLEELRSKGEGGEQLSPFNAKRVEEATASATRQLADAKVGLKQCGSIAIAEPKEES